jgi:hypothetical protein
MIYLKYYFVFFAFGLGVYACKNPLEEVAISIKDPIASAAIKIFYLNANNVDTARVPRNLKITLIGKDADKIVNSVGTKKISVSKDGLLGIAILPNYSTRPVNFTVVAEAEGFLPSIEAIEMTGVGNIERTSRMFKPSSLPTGISMGLGTVQSGNNGSSSITITTDGKKEQAQLTVPNGLITTNKAGQAVGGTLSYQLAYYDVSAKNYVPSSSTFYNATGLDNKVLKPFDFNAFGFFSLKIFNNNFDQVSNFSKPVDLNVEISENYWRVNGNKLKEGEKIPFWGYFNGTWKMLSEVVLERNEKGKLAVKIAISEATFYAFGEMIEICEKGPRFTVVSKLAGLDISYYAKLLDATTLVQTGAFYMSLNNGAVYNLSGQRPYKNKVVVHVFNYNNHYGGNLNINPIFKSEPFDICEDKKISVDANNLIEPKSVTLEISIKCPQGKVLDESQFPAAMQLQYQLSGTNNNWTDLLTLTRTVRKVKTYKLNFGKKYNLRATTNAAQGWPFLQRDTTIRQDYFLLKLDGQGYCK